MTKLLATDLDGTILARNASFNDADLEVLKSIGEQGIIRVVATGRPLDSCLKVLGNDFPIDYLVFSSGAGVYCWKEKKLLIIKHLGYKNTKALVDIFNKHHVEYTLHHPIPDNHLFFHPEGNGAHPDFERYLQFNNADAELINGHTPELDYTQTLAFMPDINTFEAISSQIKDIKVVRATSPIDGQSIWMECFNKNVSKANGILEVCKIENIAIENVTALGNDYNDLDMLSTFDQVFVVDNAPDDLKKQFDNLKSVYEAPLNDWYSRFIS